MKFVRTVLVRAAVVACVVSATGCTFRPYLRDSRDPVLSALPPCYTGDVCGEGAGFGWASDVMHSVRR